MEINDKIILNKKIRDYDGVNTFIISLKKQLKNNKRLQKVQIGNRNLKILSDNQYIVANSILL